jgi:tetratricopeptide (TPR) repeat protein
MKAKASRSLWVLTAGLAIAALNYPAWTAPAEPAVSIRQEKRMIPTYLAGGPERNPMFFFGRAYQGAQGPVYPYPFLDVLTDEIRDKSYTVLVLENEFVRYSVLPEIGGRIFEAVDKTNGYDFFYRQRVIKPALIGLLGAWISGGVEWNMPHHHRATAFMPVDWTLSEEKDGSRTIWVGELELRHRMRWLVGLTLRPGSSCLEVTYKIFNRTPFAHSILCWANAAVHTNEDYQVIFPPGTRLATFHGKNQFARWPVSREFYNGVDYSAGIDVSWYKNLPSPTSFFAFESKEDFLAGYDHGRRAGVVMTGDHLDSPGKKLWTWGTGSEGARWEKILTDEDGPYLELMFGSFSDNQPDYSWMMPYEVKTVTQHWYPLREIGGVKNATALAACNLEVGDGGRTAEAGVSASSRYSGARVLLVSGSRPVIDQKVDIDPGSPVVIEAPLAPGTRPEDLRLSLSAADGKELVSYQPVCADRPPLPPLVTPPAAPTAIQTVEELYLAGLRLEQFHNPAVDPYPYYEEALKRDPDDGRVNTALGRLFLIRGMYSEAEACLRRAAARQSRDYTAPKDGEALYYLGLALRFLDREKEAVEAFGRASWSAGWTSAASVQLAELASRRGRFEEALRFADRSLALNSLNTKAMDLRAALLRRLGRRDEAGTTARASLTLDPLNNLAANEVALVQPGFESRLERGLPGREFEMGNVVENCLEAAADYSNWGFYEEAVDTILSLVNKGGQSASYPMLHYCLASFLDRSGREAEARDQLLRAAALPPDFCFPFRLESIPVLRWASRINPQDARASYYLGNLLFDRQPAEALAAWEKAVVLDDRFATAHRNLGIAYSRLHSDLPRAVACLENAVACDPSDPRLYLELDQLCDLADVAPRMRLDVLVRNHSIVAKRDDSLAREIVLLVETGEYDRAIELLEGHHFHVWEGGGDIHGVYVDAHILRGMRSMTEGFHDRALQDFKAALEYPENLEVGRPASGGRDAELYYYIGRALEALGNQHAAGKAFERSAGALTGPSEPTYFQGLSWIRLGEKRRAKECFERLAAFALANLEKEPAMDYFAKFGERESARRRKAYSHYLLGLGRRGQGDEAAATVEFRKALELHPHYGRAQRAMGH